MALKTLIVSLEEAKRMYAHYSCDVNDEIPSHLRNNGSFELLTHSKFPGKCFVPVYGRSLQLMEVNLPFKQWNKRLLSVIQSFCPVRVNYLALLSFTATGKKT